VNGETQGDHHRSDDDRNPAALAELLDRGNRENARGHHQAHRGQRKAEKPAAIGCARTPPVNAQAEQRQRKSEKYVDRIQHHQQVDFAAAPEQDHQGGKPHDHDAVLRHEPRRQMAELMRQPRIVGHIGQDGGPAEETGVRGNEQQARFEEQHQRQGDLIEAGGQTEALDDRAKDDGVERLPLDRLRVPQQIQQDDAGSGKGERGGHVEHGELAGAHHGLAQGLHVVRYRFDSRVRSPTQRIRAQEQRQRRDPADVVRELAGFRKRVRHDQGEPVRMAQNAVADQERVSDEEPEKNGQRIRIDSFMPRMFITSNTTTSTSSVPSLKSPAAFSFRFCRKVFRSGLTGLDIAARYLPMSAVAGDFYDFLFIDEKRIGILIADVTGHGIPAALIASMLKVAFAAQAHHANDPACVLAGLNRALCGKFEEHFVTAAYLFIDLENYLLRYSAAGHHR